MTKHPQNNCTVRQAAHSAVNAEDKKMGTLLLCIVGGNPLLELLAGLSTLSKSVQGLPLHQVRSWEETWILFLSEGKQLRSQFKGSLRLASHKIKSYQSQQDGKELGAFSNPATQLSRPAVGYFYLWSRHTLREG
jgi:hypothetical protein